MAVELWFRDSLETETVAGDLSTLVNDLNVAAANGKQFAILRDKRGEGLMVETRNIIKAREAGEEDAFIGG